MGHGGIACEGIGPNYLKINDQEAGHRQAEQFLRTYNIKRLKKKEKRLLFVLG